MATIEGDVTEWNETNHCWYIRVPTNIDAIVEYEAPFQLNPTLARLEQQNGSILGWTAEFYVDSEGFAIVVHADPRRLN